MHLTPNLVKQHTIPNPSHTLNPTRPIPKHSNPFPPDIHILRPPRRMKHLTFELISALKRRSLIVIQPPHSINQNIRPDNSLLVGPLIPKSRSPLRPLLAPYRRSTALIKPEKLSKIMFVNDRFKIGVDLVSRRISLRPAWIGRPAILVSVCGYVACASGVW